MLIKLNTRHFHAQLTLLLLAILIVALAYIFQHRKRYPGFLSEELVLDANGIELRQGREVRRGEWKNVSSISLNDPADGKRVGWGMSIRFSHGEVFTLRNNWSIGRAKLIRLLGARYQASTGRTLVVAGTEPDTSGLGLSLTVLMAVMLAPVVMMCLWFAIHGRPPSSKTAGTGAVVVRMHG
nr:hypothetical protein [uncultured Lichenicoccus sp.]